MYFLCYGYFFSYYISSDIYRKTYESDTSKRNTGLCVSSVPCTLTHKLRRLYAHLPDNFEFTKWTTVYVFTFILSWDISEGNGMVTGMFSSLKEFCIELLGNVLELMSYPTTNSDLTKYRYSLTNIH